MNLKRFCKVQVVLKMNGFVQVALENVCRRHTAEEEDENNEILITMFRY